MSILGGALECLQLTIDEHPVGERVHCPYIRRPVRMTETTREREQTLEHLLELSPECERPKGTGKHRDDAHTQFDAIEEADSEVREASSLTEAVRP